MMRNMRNYYLNPKKGYSSPQLLLTNWVIFWSKFRESRQKAWQGSMTLEIGNCHVIPVRLSGPGVSFYRDSCQSG